MNKVTDSVQPELWPDEATSSEWGRDDDGTFFVKRWRNKEIDPRWARYDAAMLVGCSLSEDAADCTGGTSVCFPASFGYSPVTGKLLRQVAADHETWLPPHGNGGLKTGLVRGGKLTTVPLSLESYTQETNAAPAERLPLPAAGRFRFLVGTFGLQHAVLIAADWRNGALYCWQPGRETWVALTAAADAVYLGAEEIADELWNVECADLTSNGPVYWPCDAGLVDVRIDPLTLTYNARVVAAGICCAQPLILNDNVYVLMRTRGRPKVGLLEVRLGNSNSWSLKLDSVPDSEWHPAATAHEVMWISDAGQVVVNSRRDEFKFIAWEPADIKPEFQLGPPHCSRDGRLWMQVLHPQGHEGEVGQGFVSLGRSRQEWNRSSGPRTLSGKSSIQVERRLSGEPWIDPDVVSSEAHDNNEAVVPILESTSDGSLLVMRVDHSAGIKQFFEREETLTTRFQVMGQHADERGFFSARLRAPWKTIAFVHRGFLYLYHPEIDYLPGWRLERAGKQSLATAGGL